MYDADILFNPPAWDALVETQQALFRTKALENISDRLRQEFYHGHVPNREMPVIDPNDWNTTLLAAYADRPLGYDLPCLLSAERAPKGRIMLCAQDPLRGNGPARLTVGTFFGIDSQYHRTRRHWGMIWQLVRSFVESGYDVWVTDAIKIFAGKNIVLKDERLCELCYAVMAEEIASFQPDRVVAFGSVADGALRAARAGQHVIRVPHPTARGIRGSFRDRFDLYRNAILG
ncbi:MAG: hypothetical protein ACK4FR_14470 [Tabrizicola sp.]